MSTRAVLAAIASLAAIAYLGTGTASAHELRPEQLGALRFEQHLGAQVPPDLAFRDETGTEVAVGEYLNGGRPVILTLNYFHCQNLCPLELEGLASALNGVPFKLGDDFDVVSVSIDP